MNVQIFPLLDLRTQERVKDSLTVEGDKDYLQMIALYFIRYYKFTYTHSKTQLKDDSKIRQILSVKSKPEYVNVKRWTAYFAYRTGKYTWKEISQYMSLTAPKGNSINTTTHLFQDELEVNKVLQKEYEIHLTNLKKLFITFTLSRI